jgi:hypothetical protein
MNVNAPKSSFGDSNINIITKHTSTWIEYNVPELNESPSHKHVWSAELCVFLTSAEDGGDRPALRPGKETQAVAGRPETSEKKINESERRCLRLCSDEEH